MAKQNSLLIAVAVFTEWPISITQDFRNMSYTLPSVRGLVVHMEDRQTSILIPKNRYDQVRRSLTLMVYLSSSYAILPLFSVELSCVKLQTFIQHIWHADAV